MKKTQGRVGSAVVCCVCDRGDQGSTLGFALFLFIFYFSIFILKTNSADENKHFI